MRILPKRKKVKSDKTEVPKTTVESSNLAKLRVNCFKLKKNIFKTILKELNYPNQSINFDIEELEREIMRYFKMVESIGKLI
jgi:hypothetical protein